MGFMKKYLAIFFQLIIDELLMYPKRILTLMALLALVACGMGDQSDPGTSLEDGQAYPSSVSQASATPQSDWYQVYFTDPDAPYAGTLRGGPDEALAEAIRQARLSVDVAMDSLDLWSVRDALIAAHRQGAEVRVVVESDNKDSDEVQDLLEAGIPLVDDLSTGLMHNKFAIIDRLEVWTGSMNFTINGAYRSDNNLIQVRSSQLAQNYLVEFEEMFLDHQFGSASPANTPNPFLNVEGTEIELYFSPDDGTIERLIELVQDAQDEILFMAFSFTDDDLAQAILNRAGEGIVVAGVFDKSQALSNAGGEYTRLMENGIAVRLDGNRYGMHHKVIIIDKRIVVTGSYNFSSNARTRNDENTLILHSSEIAEIYVEEFDRVWEIAEN
jgi:phosphatidylserine/phosphatidylglycerophosphate/cardiolipin synthase-like enzyme